MLCYLVFLHSHSLLCQDRVGQRRQDLHQKIRFYTGSTILHRKLYMHTCNITQCELLKCFINNEYFSYSLGEIVVKKFPVPTSSAMEIPTPQSFVFSRCKKSRKLGKIRQFQKITGGNAQKRLLVIKSIDMVTGTCLTPQCLRTVLLQVGILTHRLIRVVGGHLNSAVLSFHIGDLM